MCVHLLENRTRSKTSPPKNSTHWIVMVGIFFALTLGLGPVQAQLGIPGFSLIPGIEGGRLGNASAVGDFNNDGFDDLAVGMSEVDLESDFSAGAVVIFVGGPGSWSDVIVVSSVFLGGIQEPGAHFGSSLATGDFDEDGFDDLAIGVPGRTINGANSAGEIAVAYGISSSSIGALTPYGQGTPIFDLAKSQFFSQVPLPGAPEADDQFGFSLAGGDFSADGVADLAIGIPYEDIQSPGLTKSAGAINVMYGVSGVGLTTEGSQLIHEDTPGVSLNANAGELFGFSLAIGQLTGNGFADLAVGAPGEVVFGPGHHGAVVLFPGAPGGLDTLVGTEAVFSQNTPGVLGTEGDGDEFGYSLAVGNFDGDGWTDLAIGVPGEAEFGTTESGAVQVLYGNAGGLTTIDDQFLVESTIDTDVDSFDRLGMALAAGDFDGDGRDDLAIGAPLDNSLGVANAGEVTVLYGSPSGATFTGHQVFDMIFFDTLDLDDLFGTALSVGRFFSQAQQSQDLAVGIPRHGTPVGFEPGFSLVIRSQPLFRDGFESGDTTAWSSTLP